MVMNVSDVLSVYKKSGGLLDDASGGSSAVTGGDGSFSDALKSFAGDSINTLHASEQAAMTSVTGNKSSDLAGIASAISKAEIMLTEVTTIRDKVISAYQAITSGAI